MKQSGLWSSLVTRGSLVVVWWLCIASSGETWKFDFLSQIWPWRSRSIAPQNNRGLNQNIFHLWSQFGDPSLNGWWVVVQTSSEWDMDFHVKFDLEGQSQSLHKTRGTLTKEFCIFGSNLVFLSWTGLELSRGQASDCHTDRHTHAHTHRRRQRQ